MANSELFILGDPRFLSGGANRCERLTCDAQASRICPSDRLITTSSLLHGRGSAELAQDISLTANAVRGLMSQTSQCVHVGRDSYHRHEYHPDDTSHRFNVFIRKEDAPTAGIELETYCRDRNRIDDMRRDLVSNWWHFEEDGSLDRTVGHELITEVLPPRIYRDLRTWTGLQNAVSPWLESWNQESTGLHVHVGVSQFDACEALPVANALDRRQLAKWAVAFVYASVIGYPLGDKVFLRRNGEYCAATSDKRLVDRAGRAASGNMRADEMFDWLLSAYDGGRSHRYGQLQALLMDSLTFPDRVRRARSVAGTALAVNASSGMSGHHIELNFQHSETIEFRRGKGTTNAVSIHRMVEFTTLLVRYVWKAARCPDMVVSPKSAFDFIIENTSSEALRRTAKDVWTKTKGN